MIRTREGKILVVNADDAGGRLYALALGVTDGNYRVKGADKRGVRRGEGKCVAMTENLAVLDLEHRDVLCHRASDVGCLHHVIFVLLTVEVNVDVIADAARCDGLVVRYDVEVRDDVCIACLAVKLVDNARAVYLVRLGRALVVGVAEIRAVISFKVRENADR